MRRVAGSILARMKHISGLGARALIVTLMAAALLAGCQFKGEREVDHEAAPGVWRPRPVGARVYPSTRFVREGRDALLEARVELTDEMGDAVKAAGELRLDLFASDDSGTSLGRRLYSWQVELLTLDDQQTYWDAITRTYLLRLRLDNREAARRPTVLRVSFAPAGGGERLEAQRGLGVE